MEPNLNIAVGRMRISAVASMAAGLLYSLITKRWYVFIALLPLLVLLLPQYSRLASLSIGGAKHQIAMGCLMSLLPTVPAIFLYLSLSHTADLTSSTLIAVGYLLWVLILSLGAELIARKFQKK